jgi:hypothetical protein
VRGASALQEVLDNLHAARLRVFVVWEPVIVTDIAPPTTWLLARIRDPRAIQYYDAGLALSALLLKTIGNRPGYLPLAAPKQEGSVVWDILFIFPPGERWEAAPPRPEFTASTVVERIDDIRRHLSQAGSPAPAALPGRSPAPEFPLTALP